MLGRWRGTPVAVKVLKACVQADATTVAEFQKEAEMLRALRHPNILDFYGACLDGDTVRSVRRKGSQADSACQLQRGLTPILAVQMMLVSEVWPNLFWESCLHHKLASYALCVSVECAAADNLKFHMGALQFMAGGDLCSAIQRDMGESERGGKRLLGWYGRGRVVLLGIARGLAYLHRQQVLLAIFYCCYVL